MARSAPDQRRLGRGPIGGAPLRPVGPELESGDPRLVPGLDVESHARGPVTGERAVELGQGARYDAEVEPLRLTGVEPIRAGAGLEREVVDLVALVDDLKHDAK
jgi:hypothetical protein